jgi:hypothetical protein
LLDAIGQKMIAAYRTDHGHPGDERTDPTIPPNHSPPGFGFCVAIEASHAERDDCYILSGFDKRFSKSRFEIVERCAARDRHR